MSVRNNFERLDSFSMKLTPAGRGAVLPALHQASAVRDICLHSRLGSALLHDLQVSTHVPCLQEGEGLMW